MNALAAVAAVAAVAVVGQWRDLGDEMATPLEHAMALAAGCRRGVSGQTWSVHC
jgi:hypothetical protein